MRRTRAFPSVLAALAILAACRGRESASDSTTAAAGARGPICVEGGSAPTITAAGVGPVRIGARLASVSDRCTVRDSSFSLGEGIQENGRVAVLGNVTVTLIVSRDSAPTIERIIIADSSIRTDAGIGVGKTVGALRAAYGRLCAATGEGRVVVGVPPLPGVSFGTSASLRGIPDVSATPEAIPDSARITGIWIYGGRSACGGS
jgi:hypothetical protein